MLKTIVYLLILMAPGQEFKAPFQNDTQVLSQQGSLVKVTVARGEPMKLFVVGRKAAEIDLASSDWNFDINPADLSVGVRRIGPKLSQIVKVKRQNNYFILEDPLKEEPVYTLEVTTEIKGKKEQFKFKIDNRPK